jgi:iron complex outermembrane recepter protein
MSQNYRMRLLATSLLAGVGVLGASASFAQAAATATTADAPGVQTADSAAAGADQNAAIVVTGSLIRNPNLSSVAPVTSIGQTEMALRQSTSAEQLVRDIPGAVPGIGSQVNNGNGGASTVNLRGLGSNRNLVLLDGQRIVPYGVGGVVDLDVIPLAVIERTDVLTGGASTTYGADAISGVVNFVTRTDFSGFEGTVTEGVTQRGDGNKLRAEATFGGNFADDRGNGLISVGYQKIDAIYQGDRNYSYNAIDSFTGKVSGSGTTVPTRFNGIFYNGSRILGNQQINSAGNALTAYYQPYNFNPLNIFQTPYNRFNIYGSGKYDVSDHIQLYTRGLYSKQTVSTILAESGAFSLTVAIPFSNPYIPSTVLGQICTAAKLTSAQCTAAANAKTTTDPNYKTFTTSLARRATEAGPRISNFTSNVFDYRVGARGDITDSIHWDVNGAYGESDLLQTIKGYTLNSRFKDALLATNTSTCLSGNANCVPVNVFGGTGVITPAMLGYLMANSTVKIHTSLAQAHGQITGEVPLTSPLASTPVNFAVGGEYRRYFASQASDSLAQSGDLGGSGGPAPNIAGAYHVIEGFGELDAPLVQDKPFFDMLELQSGIRRSHYVVETTGHPSYDTTTWKAGLNWEPVHDIKLRGNFQHAVRAPNIGELFTPVTTGLTNLATDPCAGTAPVNNANLRAICLAQGAPSSVIGQIQNPTSGQANERSGGNPALQPEISNSYTFGVVLQPSMIHGLTLSVDYYDIKVKHAITSPTPGDLVNACFGNATGSAATAAAASSAACTIIRRDPLTGQLSGDSSTVPGLLGQLSNLGKLKTSGIDLVANYTRDLGVARLNLSFDGNWTRTNKFQATPTSVNRECVGYYSVNCGSLQPKFSWTQRTTISVKDVDFSLAWKHYSAMKQEPIDAASEPAYNGVVTTQYVNGTYNFGKIKAYNTLDFAARVGINRKLDLTLTVYNLLDRQPPITGYNIGSTSYNSGNTYPSTYDPLGRRFSVSAHVKL